MQARLVSAIALAILCLTAPTASSAVMPADPGALLDDPFILMVEGEPAANVVSVEEAAALMRDPPPEGPAIPPTIQTGIGPGSGLQQSAGSGTYICSAAFLLRDPVTGTYYLSTAGHCLVRDETDTKAYNGHDHPSKVMSTISICVAGCIQNVLGLGTYVKLSPAGDYHPVAYAKSGGVGADFGLIEIPADHHDLLRPWMPQWGGPYGVSDGGTGDTLAHYGHGSYCCPTVGAVATRSPLDQARLAVLLSETGTSFTASGSSSGGDSGSGVALASLDASRAVQGQEAMGVLTHGLVVPGVPYFAGTLLSQGLNMVDGHLPHALELVEADDPLAPFVPAAPELNVSSPQEGATIGPEDDGAVRIYGRALAPGSPEATIQVAIDDASFAHESRVPVTGGENWTAYWDLGGLEEGAYTIHVRLLDGATVLAQQQRSVIIDAEADPAPPPPGHPPDPSSGQSPPSPPPGGSDGMAPVDGEGGPTDGVDEGAGRDLEGVAVPTGGLLVPLLAIAAALAIGARGRRQT